MTSPSPAPQRPDAAPDTAPDIAPVTALDAVPADAPAAPQALAAEAPAGLGGEAPPAADTPPAASAEPTRHPTRMDDGNAWAPTELMPRPAPAPAPVPVQPPRPPVAVAPPGAMPAGGNGNALPTGSHLAEFELLRVLGEGGFGIVYLAHDHTLQRRVAIKEYMPASLAMRGMGQDVVLTAEKHRAIFTAGLESFVNEARLLAQFDHPSLLKVYRFWQANNTAYMVMPFYEGQTLRDRLREMGGPPDEHWLMALLAALTEALAVIHAEHCLHRDIAPDNVLLLADSGRPLLLDFGAARQVIGDATQALTAILKPGYAPVEQYAEIPSLKQGPWTDVYALCAVVYAAVMGKKPPVSVARTVTDGYVPLAQCAAGRYSDRFLQAIDAGLRVLPDGRPQTVHAFRQALGLDGSSAAVLPPMPAPVVRPRYDAPAPPPAPAPAPAANRTPVLVGGALALLILGGAGLWVSQRGAGPTGGTLTTGPATAGAPAATPAPPSAPVAEAPAPGPASPPVASPAAAPFSIEAEFDRLLLASDSSFDVQAKSDAPRLRINRDRLAFKVSSARDGFVYVLVAGPDGSLVLLYPNQMAQDSRIRAGQTLALPQSNWKLDTSEPAGVERFAVIVSEHPRDFSHLSQDRVAWFLSLPTGDAAAKFTAAHTGRGSVLAGKARCSGDSCDRYGVALFSVDVVP